MTKAQTAAFLAGAGVVVLAVGFLIPNFDREEVPPRIATGQPQGQQPRTPNEPAAVTVDEVFLGDAELVDDTERQPVSDKPVGVLDDDPAIYLAEECIKRAMDKGANSFLSPTKIEEVLADPKYNPQGKALSEDDLAKLTGLARSWDDEIANARLHEYVMFQQAGVDAIRRGDYVSVDGTDPKTWPMSMKDLLAQDGTVAVALLSGPKGSSRTDSRLVVHTKKKAPDAAASSLAVRQLRSKKDAAILVFISEASGH